MEVLKMFYLLLFYVCVAHMYGYVPCVCCACAVQRKQSDSLELGLQEVLRHHVASGNQVQALCKYIRSCRSY